MPEDIKNVKTSPRIEQIFSEGRRPAEIIDDLKKKSLVIKPWSELRKEYDPKQHPVYTDPAYRDKATKNGLEKMTRVTYPIQKQATKRMKELMFSIPVKRNYTTANDQEKKAAAIMEAIFKKNHINSLNIKRAHKYFASCEMATVWYAQMQDTTYAGERSLIKLRCRTYSPMDGDELYPLFDEYDDMIALSVGYSRTIGERKVQYFDCLTANMHYRWVSDGTSSGWVEDIAPEPVSIKKIQGIYLWRPEPIWEDQSENGYEMEWQMSRNGNYLRKNSRPTWVIYSDNNRVISKDPKQNDNTSSRDVLRYGKDDKAGYATWNQAIESMKFHQEELRRSINSALQLPDLSMDKMSAIPMSGEARKMLFIDCQMKVTDESGDWIEFFDREVNVVRAFCCEMFPQLAAAFNTLQVENIITPYRIDSLSDDIKDGVTATNGKAVASRRTVVRRLGLVPESEIDDELQRIDEEEATTADAFINEPTM